MKVSRNKTEYVYEREERQRNGKDAGSRVGEGG